MEVRKLWLGEIAGELEAVPAAERARVTALTLKATVCI
jgi:hypothetical protein